MFRFWSDSLLWRSSSKKDEKSARAMTKFKDYDVNHFSVAVQLQTRQNEKSMNDDELDSFAETLQQKTDDGKRER
jgi:hypothetical protein